ncbi:MAG TPA: hypothetical protein VEJ44_02095, partial [Acidimicrobiales bacterium]|nr:hypothetical protein [Acidimicrobiales bacterium]
MTVDALEGEGPSAGTSGRTTTAPARTGRRRSGGEKQSRRDRAAGAFELKGLVLLDAAGNAPVRVHALTFGDDGIGLVGREGSSPRLLPWTSVATHAVEPWRGGAIPQWWIDTGRQRTGPPRRVAAGRVANT